MLPTRSLPLGASYWLRTAPSATATKRSTSWYVRCSDCCAAVISWQLAVRDCRACLRELFALRAKALRRAVFVLSHGFVCCQSVRAMCVVSRSMCSRRLVRFPRLCLMQYCAQMVGPGPHSTEIRRTLFAASRLTPLFPGHKVAHFYFIVGFAASLSLDGFVVAPFCCLLPFGFRVLRPCVDGVPRFAAFSSCSA